MKVIRHNIKEPLELHQLEVGKTYIGTNWHSHGELVTPLDMNRDCNMVNSRYFVFGVGELSYDVVEEEKSLYTEVDIEIHVSNKISA